MGTVRENITLRNAGDAVRVQEGLIREVEVRSETVLATVDTGAMSLIISEDLRERLGLSIRSHKAATFANSSRQLCGLTEPVEIHWKDRVTVQQALVVPGAHAVLLGVIPLESLDLMVDPVHQGLVGIHGDAPIELVL